MPNFFSGLPWLRSTTLWHSGAHRFWYWFCGVCLTLYLAWAAYLSRSGLLVSTADTIAALLWFGVFATIFLALLHGFSGWAIIKAAPAHRARLSARVFVAGAMVSLGILMVYLMAYDPGGVTVDSAVQWTQASTGQYSNWHPVFHTLLLRLCWLVKPDYTFAVAVQCGVFSIAMGYLVATLHAWGVKSWLLLTMEALTVASPIVGHTMMYLWKDNAMTIGVVVALAQVINLYFSRGQWLRRPVNAVAFGLALAFTTLVRHNALLWTVPLTLVAGFTLPKPKRGFFVAVATLVAALSLVWGPLYAALNVTYPNNALEESIGLPMTVISNLRKQNPNAMDAQTRAFTNSMADEAGWEAYRVNEYNTIKFGATREAIAHMTARQILSMAANAAKADPRGAFLTVCAVTDLVWGLSDEGMANVKVRNSGNLPSVPKVSGRLNSLGKTLEAFVAAPLELWPVGWYFGNIGVSLALMLCFALRALRQNGSATLLFALPTLLYALGTMCVLCGNDARFFAFSPLACTFSLFVLTRRVSPKTELTDEGIA